MMKKEVSESKSGARVKTYAESLVEKFEKQLAKEKEEKERKKAEAKKIPEKEKYVKWLNELNRKDIIAAGGKGANLAELFNIKMPVPPAFVITAQAYSYFINSAEEEIDNLINNINVDNTEELERTAKQIREVIENAEMPDDLREEITEAYSALDVAPQDIEMNISAISILKASREPIFVAVRSSATTEDLATASFAGQQETFLNVKGNSGLIEAVKKCFASLFTARAIYYRKKRGFEQKAQIAVIIQRMINSEKSGVIFTINPTNKKEEIVIEAVFGLGEGIVSGAIEPDQYIVEKRHLKTEKKHISRKEIFVTRTASGETVRLQLPESKQEQQVLSEFEIKKLSNYALNIEEHFKAPQDIEFAVERGECYILQTRPVTTLQKEVKEYDIGEKKILLSGFGASPGVASGVVKIIHDLHELAKVKKGDVLVTKMTNPDMVVTMQRANAIVTDEGGVTCHAAIVSREMGIPAVVGTRKATAILQEGQIITVDGSAGRVYEGSFEEKKVQIFPIMQTKTKIKVIIDLPQAAARAAETHAEGIGLLRLEGIIASARKHPLAYLNNEEEYEQLIYNGIEKIAKHFSGKEIWIRTSDIRTDEFSDLEGAPETERNPMLGMHGIRASLKNSELLKAELKAIKKIAEWHGKIGVMMPQVISIEEVTETKRIIEELGMKVKMGVMVETPAAVEIIEDLCAEVDFISFGTNDLTQFTLAIDRGNEELQEIYNEMHPAVLHQLSRVTQTCKERGVETSICGQAASRKEMAIFLVREGIDSISVNADAAHEISKAIKEVEEEIERGEEKKEERIEELTKEEGKESAEEKYDDKKKLEEEVGKSFNVFKKYKKKPKSDEEIYQEYGWDDLGETDLF